MSSVNKGKKFDELNGQIKHAMASKRWHSDHTPHSDTVSTAVDGNQQQ